MTKKYVGSSGHSLKVRGAKHFIDEVDEARKVTNEVHRILTTQYNGIGSVFHDNTSTTQNQNLQTIVNFHNKQIRTWTGAFILMQRVSPTHREALRFFIMMLKI